jgi:ribosomal protein S18 acetylase RimI-like enzyme
MTSNKIPNLMRLATTNDLPQLLDLMRGYYRDDGLEFDAVRATATMGRLLSEPQWGRVYLIEAQATVVGYIAICVGFSLELGGNEAFVDELFVLPEHRGRGHARRALEAVTTSASTWGIAALHLEVDRENLAAQRLYSQLGYKKRDRYYFMTATLETPT